MFIKSFPHQKPEPDMSVWEYSIVLYMRGWLGDITEMKLPVRVPVHAPGTPKIYFPGPTWAHPSKV